MNEMNNGNNGYVDPNMNNQNMNNGYNQNMNNGYNQNMNYQGQPVNNNEEPPKKSNGALVAILILLVLGLVGFIVYDKVIKKEEQPKQAEVPKDEKYFEVKTTTKKMNNSELKLEYKFYVNSDVDGEVAYDLFVNGAKIGEIGVTDLYELAGDENLCGGFRNCFDYLYGKGTMNSSVEGLDVVDEVIKETINNATSKGIGIIKDSFSTNEYLYIYIDGNLWILDSSANILTKNKLQDGTAVNYMNIVINGQYFDDLIDCTKTYSNQVAFENNAIYYLYDEIPIDDNQKYYTPKNDEDIHIPVAEHRITINNGELKNEVVKVCAAEINGVRL